MENKAVMVRAIYIGTEQKNLGVMGLSCILITVMVTELYAFPSNSRTVPKRIKFTIC